MNKILRNNILAASIVLGLLPASQAVMAQATAAAEQTTIILVHGAFAGSESWNDVSKALKAGGYAVISAANPLRGIKNDADYVGALAASIKGPVVMVGHSYGGTVITNAATGKANVKALVYVGAFAPDVNETVVELAGKYPGSTLGPSLSAPVVLADGGKDLYIAKDKFHKQFAADVTAQQASAMAISQRPITEAAILEKSGDPAWKSIPSWFIYGTADKNIPPASMKFMAERAKGKKIVEIAGASHVPQAKHPKQIVQMIVEAARATQ
jgi:pimeloyl-ACP methyl ester carboxylesterase